MRQWTVSNHASLLTLRTLLTDLLLPLEDIQPPVLCRFPRFRWFMVLEHDTGHIRCPGVGRLFRRYADRVTFRR